MKFTFSSGAAYLLLAASSASAACIPRYSSSSSSTVAQTSYESSATAAASAAEHVAVTTSSAAAAATTSSASKAASSTSSASSSTSSSSSSTSKRGLGFNDVDDTTSFGGKVSWAYNWYSSLTGDLTSGVEYVPMLWGTDSSHTDSWTDNANSAIENGATALLGFNEPDLSSQSNISPSDAAAAWKTYMEPFAGKVKLVSPAVTNGAPPTYGTGWLDSFLEACTDCTIDAIAIHIYDAASNTDYFKEYISSVGTKYGKPVWVTEFGATGSTSDQQTFLETMLPYLDSLDSVERYAYFGDFVGTFVSDALSLTDLGETYAST